MRGALLVACALGVAAVGCGEPARPNVVVVLLDTVRADGLEPYGARAGASAELARLAEESVVFENAFSSSSFTAPSVASLFTGQYATRHGVTIGLRARTLRSSREQQIALPRLDAAPLLPVLMKEAGYATFGISTNPQVGRAIGFERGFDRFVETRMVPRVLEKLAAWEPELAAASPFFLYVHINDAHAPYWARGRWFREPKDPALKELAAYVSEIAYVDDAFGQVLELADPGGEAVVVVVTDHGEEFGDHGGSAHGFSLHAELNRVAMVLRAPGLPPGRVKANVSLVDLLPTLLDLVGAAPPEAAELDGRSLLPLARAEAQGEAPDDWRARALFAHREEQSKDARVLEAVIRENWKLIVGEDGAKLYDLARDSTERNDLAEAQPERVAELRALLAEVPRLDPERRVLRETTLDERQLEELRELGYVE